MLASAVTTIASVIIGKVDVVETVAASGTVSVVVVVDVTEVTVG